MRKKLVLITFFSIIVITTICIISNSALAIGNEECMCQDTNCHLAMDEACGAVGGTGEYYYYVRYACCMGGTWCETGYQLMCIMDGCRFSFTRATCECSDSRCDPL